MNNNLVKANKIVGFYAKDQFISELIGNKFLSNKIEMFIDEKNEGFNREITKNDINGDVRYSNISVCSIF